MKQGADGAKALVTSDWLDRFPALRNLDSATRAILRDGGQLLGLMAGMVPFRAGQRCENFIFILDGALRAQMLSESGREIVLYRVVAGEICILTTSCLLGHMDYPAEAFVERDAQVVLLPRRLFRECIDRSEAFRDFVFDGFGRRMADLLTVVEEVAFRRLDVRLARLLLDRKDSSNNVHLSHQSLAAELGTVREVISRQLKDLERRRWLILHRGWIEVCDVLALRQMAGA